MPKSPEILQAIFDTAVDTILTIDDKGIIQTCNPTTEKMFGFKPEEILGKNVNMLMPEPYKREHDGYLHRYLTTGEKRIIGIGRRVTAQKKDGTTFPISLAVSEANAHGKRFFVGAIRDITAMVKVEEALEKINQELSRSNIELEQFAYVASHDLQEPLRMVASFTELLARRYKGKLDADAEEFMRHIVDGTHRMQTLVKDLLLLSRVGSQGKPTKPTEASAVFDQALHDLSLLIKETSSSVTRDELPKVMADEAQLRQLFQNLIGNSIKFRNKDVPCKIHASAKPEGDRLVFCIEDNGIGIDPQYFERIFVIFQRLQGREEYPGTGIGLAICKKIVERHGGKIWVESAPGKGSKFFFTLHRVGPKE